MKSKIWFITGISSGLGKALADALIENGDFVIGTFRKASQVEEFNAQHQEKAFSYQLDITDSQDIKFVVENVLATFGKIDVLVNNAGYGFAGAIEETSDAEVRAVFEANFFGSLHMTQAVLPIMRKQKSGHIIQISSHGGIKAFAGFGIYNASKFALEGFSEALAQEVAPLGIKLTIVEPGPFRTGFANAAFIEAEHKIEDYQTTSGAFKERMKAVDGKQEGDPAKAVKAIIQITKIESPPLRLPLGKVPITTIQMKIDSVQKDLNDWKSVAESVVFE
ncbi:MAG: short-chain dehydrogenase/reductase [Cytophagaceae bacterium BCCC1]|nr:MAG: short-chain dehydrogenase/reductase [Cytophagaceae bacterium BCCC1]